MLSNELVAAATFSELDLNDSETVKYCHAIFSIKEMLEWLLHAEHAWQLPGQAASLFNEAALVAGAVTVESGAGDTSFAVSDSLTVLVSEPQSSDDSPAVSISVSVVSQDTVSQCLVSEDGVSPDGGVITIQVGNSADTVAPSHGNVTFTLNYEVHANTIIEVDDCGLETQTISYDCRFFFFFPLAIYFPLPVAL